MYLPVGFCQSAVGVGFLESVHVLLRVYAYDCLCVRFNPTTSEVSSASKHEVMAASLGGR